jgi:hypothetical protein
MSDQRGTSREYALRRLETAHPDLHRKVTSGQMSAYAAMVEAGIEKKRFTVLLNTPEDIAAVLRRNLPADVLADVVWLLAQKEAS